MAHNRTTKTGKTEMTWTRFLRYWIPPVLWMLLFFPLFNKFLGSPVLYRTMLYVFQLFSPDISAAAIEIPYILLRKSLHFIEFMVLAFLIYRAFSRNQRNRWDIRWAFPSVIIGISYGFLDEYLQTFIPSRNGSILDGIIDSLGVMFALGLIAFKARKKSSDGKDLDQDQKRELSQETL